MRVLAIPYARLALGTVFIWFGLLKVISLSPASPLVFGLLEITLPAVDHVIFGIVLGILEMVIGIAFLIPRCERIAMALLIPHMITTFLPLFFMPSVVWQSFLVPTMEGQYIIKNLIIIALAFGIAAQMHPFHAK